MLAEPNIQSRGQPVRDYVSVVSDAALYQIDAAAVDAFGANTRFKYPKIETAESTIGFALFCAGKSLDQPDIIVSIRPISADERLRCVGNGVAEPVDIQLGFAAAVLVEPAAATAIQPTDKDLFLAVAEKVPEARVGGVAANGLTTAMVKNGAGTWNEVGPGLPDRPIHLLLGPPVSAARRLFGDLVIFPGCRAVPTLAKLEQDDGTQFRLICGSVRRDGKVDETYHDEVSLAAAMSTDPQAIGLASFNFFERSAADLRALPINGVIPSAASINDGTYPAARPVYMYVKQGNISLVPGLRDFLDEISGEKAAGAHGYLAKAGLVPLAGQAETATRNRVRDVNTPKAEVQSATSPALEQARAAEKAREQEAARAARAEHALAVAAAAAQTAERERAAVKADLEVSERARIMAQAEVQAAVRARLEAVVRTQAAEQQAKAAQATARDEHDTLDRRTWELASGNNDPGLVQNYLTLFPQGIFAEQARARSAAPVEQEQDVVTVLHFGAGEVTLPPTEEPALAGVIERLRRKSELRLIVEGHSDNTGRPEVNQSLALRRAQGLVARIVAAGIDPARVGALDFGADRPVRPNETAAGRASNRRVELRTTPGR